MVRLGKGEGGREEEILNAPVSEVFRLVFFFFFSRAENKSRTSHLEWEGLRRLQPKIETRKLSVV